MKNLKRKILPYVAQAITSDTLLSLKRGLAGMSNFLSGDEAVIYLRVDDPYSYVFAQILPDFLSHYPLKCRIEILAEPPAELYVEPELWDKNAHLDCLRLAVGYGLNFPDKTHKLRFSSQEGALVLRPRMLSAGVVSARDVTELLDYFCDVAGAYWSGGQNPLTNSSDGDIAELEAATKSLYEKGHYLTGTIYYGGEWYWGIDRIGHLARRLDESGVAKYWQPRRKIPTPLIDSCDRFLYRHISEYDEVLDGHPVQDAVLHARRKARNAVRLKDSDFEGPEATLYFSFRSPYSYIVLERFIALCEGYYKKLVIKPVLPMVMRGLSVPNVKKFYILHDTKREAKRYGVDFGFINDPVGPGIIKCISLFIEAQKRDQSIAFTHTVAKAIWSEGFDCDDADSWLTIYEKLGWEPLPESAIFDPAWEPLAEGNREELYNKGLWGVPSFEYKKEPIWGQDRLWYLEALFLQ